MFGIGNFDWTPFKAESIFLKKKAETHQGGYDTSDEAGEDGWSYEDLGWVSDPCDAKFFIQDLSTPAGCATLDDGTTTCTTDKAVLWYADPDGENTINGVSMSNLMVEGEARIDSYGEAEWADSITRILNIVNGGYDDPISYPKLSNGSRAISISFGYAEWTWFDNHNIGNCEGDGPQPIDCEFGEWGEWGLCTPDTNTYKGGSQTRIRPIITQPQHGGRECPTNTHNYPLGPTEWRQCYVPQNCEWGAWSVWTEWTECFGGEKSRRRQRGATISAEYGGQPCIKLNGDTGDYETQEELVPCSCPEGYEFFTWGQGGQGDCVRTPCDDENREQDDEGGCDVDCKDGYEFDSQKKCQEIPPPDETPITPQSDKTKVVVPQEGDKKTNLPLVVGGIAILGIGGYYFLQK